MDNLKDRLKRSIIKKIIFLGIILIILLSGVFIFKENFKVLLSGPCMVNSLNDIEKCKGKFSKVKINKVFDTEFSLIINTKTAGQFLDIGIENKSLIAVLKNDNAKSILASSTNKYAYGKLVVFKEGALKEGYDSIVNQYIKKFGGNASSEDIKNAFTSFQLDGYNYTQIYMYAPTIALLIPILVVLILIGFYLKRMFAVVIKGVNGVDYDFLDQQIDRECLYKGLDLVITPTYFVCLKSSSILINKTHDLFWIYSISDKLYLRFKNKTKCMMPLSINELKKVSELLMRENKDVLKGNSKTNLMEWENLLMSKNK